MQILLGLISAYTAVISCHFILLLATPATGLSTFFSVLYSYFITVVNIQWLPAPLNNTQRVTPLSVVAVHIPTTDTLGVSIA